MSATVYYRLSADASLGYRRNGRSQSSPPAFSSNEIPFPISAGCYSAKLNLDAIALPVCPWTPSEMWKRGKFLQMASGGARAAVRPKFEASGAGYETGRPLVGGGRRRRWSATVDGVPLHTGSASCFANCNYGAQVSAQERLCGRLTGSVQGVCPC